jgi:hypothetical protein
VETYVCIIFFPRKIRRSSFSQENGMLGAIGLCVDNLPENMKCYYNDFALFVEDVNIKPEVKLLCFLLQICCFVVIHL